MSNPEVINGSDSLIGSPQWYEFLDMPSTKSFRYESRSGSFTARKRPNGTWNAYRKLFGKLRQEYLGLSKSLSPKRLEEIAARLALSDMEYWTSKAQSKKVIHKESITGTKYLTQELQDAQRISENLKLEVAKLKQELKISQDQSQFNLKVLQKVIALLESALELKPNAGGAIKKKIREVLQLMSGIN